MVEDAGEEQKADSRRKANKRAVACSVRAALHGESHRHGKPGNSLTLKGSLRYRAVTDAGRGQPLVRLLMHEDCKVSISPGHVRGHAHRANVSHFALENLVERIPLSHASAIDPPPSKFVAILCLMALACVARAQQTQSAPQDDASARVAWHKTMKKTPLPKHGCFTVKYPSTQWQERHAPLRRSRAAKQSRTQPAATRQVPRARSSGAR